MFGKENKIVMDKLTSIKATSKLSLKLSCLVISDGDLDKAMKMYEFFAQDMNLPDTDPIPPSKLEAIKHSVNEVGGLIKDNKDDIMDLANFVMGLIGKKAPVTGGNADIPPLPN